ncbi:LamG-like jellyroll fold domain-containing protein [Halosolutus gelatinilyticus]|uniref:LamG-like jellyroll fold domain-containing protein n=1 Tax=Halosolutus gelatinilyticus TaxID=2931975 RepID=UPI001FF2C0D9|nr:LamG-like jellyroll fold domain-containing protein [Halosolutus gelatinilyticus]
MSDNSTDDARDEPNQNNRTDDATVGRLERRGFLKGLAATGALGGVGIKPSAAAKPVESGWEPKPVPFGMETPWTSDVGPENARPEYPRPQMVREEWRNLNGVWQFAGAAEGESPPIGEALGERILVPYPVESPLSGIARHETWMWYRRRFEVPDEWIVPEADPEDGENNPNAQRLLVHFERVDWEATVYVNGEEVARHKGGYDHFVADVTDALVEGGPQELVVGVYDPTGNNTEPIGTQPKGRQGVGTGYGGEGTLWMTPTSGIWDTVWMEPVAEAHVENLELTPDLDEEVLRLTAEAPTDDATVVATAYDEDGEKVGRVIGSANEELELPVPDPRLWSPDDPFLYDLDVKLRRKDGAGRATEAGGGKLLDRVESYFGMRSLGMQEVGGTARPTLNGEMVYQIGSLESGTWPDGLQTAPTDEAQRYNLELQKELGYNTVRKHATVETRRWFYHADRLGLLVWQDIPNMHESLPNMDDLELIRNGDTRAHFKREVRAIVSEHDTHPSMAVWTPFNEGWGIYNDNLDFVREVTEMIAELDPERLVDANSGYDVGSNSDSGAGHIKDVHQYPGPKAPEPEPDRISALGEFTTPSVAVEGHVWGEPNTDVPPEQFVDEYVEGVDKLRTLMVGQQLSASVYTATTDLENVTNGHVTYDREVFKPTLAENGLERIREAHETIIEESKLVMGNAVIDVEVPSSYDSGGVLGSPNPFEIAATFANPESGEAVGATVENVAMSVSGLPDNWSIAPDGETEIDAVDEGESVTVAWEITPDEAAGNVTLEVAVDYTIGSERLSHVDERELTPSLLAYWQFEDSPADSSNLDNPVSLQNGAGFDDQIAVEGEYSLTLDGEDDYALISDFNEGILHDAFTERTVSTWIRPDSTSGLQCIYNEGGHFNGFAIRLNDGTLEACAANSGTTVTVGGSFERTEWTHVAAVFDEGMLRLYVNGEEVAANEDVGFETVPDHVAGSAVGGSVTTTPWNDGQENFFGGHVDATAVYSAALSEDRLTELFESV